MHTFTYSHEQAKAIYEMGLCPALAAGFNAGAALEDLQHYNEQKRVDDAKKISEDEKNNLYVGKVVNDGRLGKIVEIDGPKVKLVGYYERTWWALMSNLSDWSFRKEVA